MPTATTPKAVGAGYASTVLPKSRWDAVRDFVTESVSAAVTEDWSADKTRGAFRTVARLADYASMTARGVAVRWLPRSQTRRQSQHKFAGRKPSEKSSGGLRSRSRVRTVKTLPN